MTRIASRVSQLNGEGALAVYSRAKELERQGRSIIHLELGEPDFHPAAPVVDALRDAVTAGRDRYCSTRGTVAVAPRGYCIAQCIHNGCGGMKIRFAEFQMNDRTPLALEFLGARIDRQRAFAI